MKNTHSVATIDAPEFINIEPYNPLISKCEVKVFYLGENRNGSFIDRNAALKMANSLPGTPIVGAYNDEKEDFGDHGHKIVIEDGEIKFSCKTVPYGFVAPDALVWFQRFSDQDEFGNEIQRDYLMTQGYLWTGQYPELEDVLEHGKGQSMELDEKNVDGHWATNNKTGVELFIINDAVFSKLCILGDDVEPCFEGAAVTSPNVSKDFTKDGDFAKTLYSMMNDLQFALKGGLNMENEDTSVETSEEVVETSEENDEFACGTGSSEKKKASENACGGGSSDKKKKYADEDSKETDPEPKEAKAPADDSKGKKKVATKHSLEEQFEDLQTKFSQLKSENDSLRQANEDLLTYKNSVENEKKDTLIKSFYMLTDEDKADVIEHKDEYSLNDIESKLAVVCYHKKINFDGVKEEVNDSIETEESSVITTFNLDGAAENVPAYVQALRAAKIN